MTVLNYGAEAREFLYFCGVQLEAPLTALLERLCRKAVEAERSVSHDYVAEAVKWLEGEPHCLNPDAHGAPCGCFNVESLAALLERLCGEAQDQKCEAIHPGFAEFRMLQKVYIKRIAEIAAGKLVAPVKDMSNVKPDESE